MNAQEVETYPLVRRVGLTDDELRVWLTDGRTISVPLARFPRLAGATMAQLREYEILGDGEGVHWPELDEDLSIEGLLVGVRLT